MENLATVTADAAEDAAADINIICLWCTVCHTVVAVLLCTLVQCKKCSCLFV